MQTRARTIKPRTQLPADGPAVVLEARASGETARVRDRAGLAVEARLAHLPHWQPAPGDRVLLADVEGEPWIIAVLVAARARGDSTIVEAPSGDLVLRAPKGRVRLEAGLDLELDAARDLTGRAGRDRREDAGRAFEVSAGAARGERGPQLRIDPRETELSAERLVLRAKVTELAAGALSLFAKTISSRALQISQEASRWELSTGELVEKARESVREVEGLAHQRLGRAATIVRETFSLRSNRTDLLSEEETAIDGRKVLLG